MWSRDKDVSKWRMVAIGPSEISKTSSLVEVYDRINNGSRNGYFDFKYRFAENPTLSRWARDRDSITPTSRTRTFDLSLVDKRGKTVTAIEWVDTVGGSIDVNSPYHDDTVSAVRNASIVFVFIGCDDLVKVGTRAEIERTQRMLESTVNLLRHAAYECMIVFCLCKYDLVQYTCDVDDLIEIMTSRTRGSLDSHGALTTNNFSDRSPAIPVMEVIDMCTRHDLEEISRLHVLKRRGLSKAVDSIGEWKRQLGAGYGGVWIW